MGRSGQHYVIGAWRDRGFRRLVGVRLAGQFGDGVFQASLAGAVLFDPQRAGHASDVAAAFAVLLLPYSFIGPFAGVLLDRWWRQRVLTAANAVRAVAVVVVAIELAAGVSGFRFYASGLIGISLARFVLSALSAAQPRVVPPHELVTANALVSTFGTVTAAAGGGTAILVRAALGSSNRDYAVIAALSAAPYVVAALAATGFGRQSLGPSAAERRARETPAEVLRGFRAGARAVHAAPQVENGLAMIALHRLLFGVWTVCTVLMYRNLFPADGVFRSGLAGLSQVVAAVAVGSAAASAVTPAAYRRLGPTTWPALMLLASAAIEAALVLPFRLPLLLASALLLAFTSQGIKISVDTVLQRGIGDAYRGRVFALYDMLFNVALVVAATVTALALPESGRSVAAAASLTVLWAITAALYVSRSGRRAAAQRASLRTTT